VLSYIYTWN